MDKTFDSSLAAIHDIRNGATIMTGGFGLCGIPENLIRALLEKGVRDLTIVSNNIGSSDLKQGGAYGVALLFRNRQVRKFIGSFPGPVARLDWFLDMYEKKEVEVEIMPQGTLNERIRLAVAGLGGVYTPVGAGTLLAEGKEARVIDGKEYLLELPLKADFALVKAHTGDRMGNLVYRRTARNYNAVMAGAAAVTVAEVEHLVEPGAIDPDQVHTPGIFVQRVVKGELYERRV
ncbi:MAG: 3-oxoacid CoA-transferase subunit A [Deltaproteobacteria bacterium]|nr:3-oxoacid CoA-transferase subunit A [Deltaproteobacteria bacterium]